jgi:hypothetical protein
MNREKRPPTREIHHAKADHDDSVAGPDRRNRAEGEEVSPMARNPPWAPEEDQRLKALALSGASVAEMAKQMKRSEEAVRSRAYRLKIVLAKSHKLRLKAKGK